MSYREFAETVRTLIGFVPVLELFVFYVERWRRKQRVIAEHIKRIDLAVAPLSQFEWPFKFTSWVLHGVGNGRRCYVPPELQEKYERLENRPSLFPRDDDDRIRPLTPSERFTALAVVHDSLSEISDSRIGPSELGEYPQGDVHYVVAVITLSSKPDATILLRSALASVLARIENRVDPLTMNQDGELLIDVIVRLRKQWELHSTKSLATQARLIAEIDPFAVQETSAELIQQTVSIETPTAPSMGPLPANALSVLAKLTGSELPKLISILQDATFSGEQKMDALLRADNGLERLDSTQWAELLHVSPNAVRQYDVWKALRRKERAAIEE